MDRGTDCERYEKNGMKNKSHILSRYTINIYSLLTCCMAAYPVICWSLLLTIFVPVPLVFSFFPLQIPITPVIMRATSVTMPISRDSVTILLRGDITIAIFLPFSFFFFISSFSVRRDYSRFVQRTKFEIEIYTQQTTSLSIHGGMDRKNMDIRIYVYIYIYLCIYE